MFRLIRELGVPANARTSEDWYDGVAIHAGPYRPVEEILHDVAHWILAPISRRRVVDFGLGKVPSGETPVEPPMLMSMERSAREEVLASGLGITLVAWSGCSSKRVQQNFTNHAWPYTGRTGHLDLAAAWGRAAKAGFEVPRPVRARTIACYERHRAAGGRRV